VPERLALSFELAVGCILVLLGALNLAGRALPEAAQVHTHPHDRGHHRPAENAQPPTHVHAHVHTADVPWLRALERSLGLAQAFKSFVLGLAHGLAGSAGIALLVLATIPGTWAGLIYLLLFGMGTVLGMMAMTLLMGASMAALGGYPVITRYAVPATGLLSLIYGGYMVYRIGFAQGLLTF